MNALQDAREAMARRERVRAGNLERVNLGDGRRGGVLASPVGGAGGLGHVCGSSSGLWEVGGDGPPARLYGGASNAAADDVSGRFHEGWVGINARA